MDVSQSQERGVADPNAPQRAQHPLANYQFSPEEMRALRDCNTESFYQRSLPIGASLGIAAYLGVKQGYLRPNVKYGSVPKVLGGIIIGYFVGKFSYQRQCEEKIMKLPNSRLAEVLRQKHSRGLYGMLTPDQSCGAGLALGPFTPNTGDIYNDEYTRESKSRLESDLDYRPTLSGLDDTYRPSVDDPSPQFDTELPIAAKPGATYEELRAKNREEYAKKSLSFYPKPRHPDSSTPHPSNETPGHAAGQDDFLIGRKNKYGDSWTN